MNSSSPAAINASFPVASASAVCAALGHKVHHTRIDKDARTRCVRCEAPILGWDESVSRVAHTLSCFLGWHHYVAVAHRAGHNEYVCERCGHPLLFATTRDPYSTNSKFKKKVNYGCGLLGHRVHIVREGSETTEYACRCGHSFVKRQRSLTVIRHPLTCVLLGHLVSINEIRGGWAEYLCLRCGHPFCFRLANGELIAEREFPRPLGGVRGGSEVNNISI